MSRQIGLPHQRPRTAALEDRIRALELRIEALNDAVTALREQLASQRQQPQVADVTDREPVRDLPRPQPTPTPGTP